MQVKSVRTGLVKTITLAQWQETKRRGDDANFVVVSWDAPTAEAPKEVLEHMGAKPIKRPKVEPETQGPKPDQWPEPETKD